MLKSHDVLRSDPTSTYSVNSAEVSLELAKLARQCGYLEWAWVHAANCLAVMRWKGQEQTQLAQDAQGILRETASQLDPYRLEDLCEKHEKDVAHHNSLDQLRFKLRVQRENLGLWKRIMGRSNAPDLRKRPY